MNNFCCIFDIRRLDRLRNEDVRRYVVRWIFLERHMDSSLLKWYSYVGCMTYDRLLKIYGSLVEISRRRGRPQDRWTDAVSEFFRVRVTLDEDARGTIFNCVQRSHLWLVVV